MSAFTLIEIMIVVAIIGLLAAVAVPNFLRHIERARKQSCLMNLKQIATAKFTWALEEQKPSTATPTEADMFGPAKPILNKPVCPSGGTYALHAVADQPTCSVETHTP